MRLISSVSAAAAAVVSRTMRIEVGVRACANLRETDRVHAKGLTRCWGWGRGAAAAEGRHSF